jgi:preprotein translocase subunit SecG
MELISLCIGAFYLLATVFVIIALVFLIVRRLKSKKEESFEQRDN